MSLNEDTDKVLPDDFIDTLGALDSNEDLVQWMNALLSADDSGKTGDLSTMDRLVSRLIASLDIASEDTSLRLENLIDDISRSASRLHYDLHFVRDGALSLQSLMNDLSVQANGALSAETKSALSKLHTLDLIKQNMSTARYVLREAESWSTLESEVSSLLMEQNYEKAAEKLNEANKSMVVFQNTTDYEHRRALMVSLQNQLEASLSSALISAINSGNVTVCRAYYAIFDNIQRDAEFRTYYYGSRRSSLVKMWQDAYLTDTGETPPTQPTSPAIPFSVFLSSFFAAFLGMLNTEKTSVSAIFPDPQSTLSTFITSTMSSLQPTFTQRLTSLSDQLGASALTEQIAAFKAVENFAVSADKILERTGTSSVLSPSEDDGAAHNQKLHRRRSSRMSISRRLSIGSSLMARSLTGSGLDWDHELFEPFMEIQEEYGVLETRFLIAALDASEEAENDQREDQAHALRERAVDAFSFAEESFGRMLALTHGYGAASLVKALDTYLQSFVDKSKHVSMQLPSMRANLPSGGSDLADLDYSLEDWAHIQAWLHLLESIRAVFERANVFETKLRSVMLQVATSFRSQDGGLPYVPGATRGEITLLMQSGLNTLELQNLLKDAFKDVEHEGRQSSQDSFRRMSTVKEKELLTLTREAISGYTATCQTALQDAMLAPLRKHLASYAAAPLWTSTPQDKSQARRGGISDVQVPTFSLSPTETIQRVAEGLLNLPRLFEVYQDDDVLAFSLETLPFADAALLESLTEQTDASQHSGHMRRPSIAFKPAPVALSAEAIESVWLSSLGHALLAHLTTVVLPQIKTLSSNGTAQLISDLSYLGNVIGALNAESEEFSHWREHLALSDDDGRRAVIEGTKSDTVFSSVARMRGWTTTLT